MKVLNTPRRAAYLSVGLLDFAVERRRELQGQITRQVDDFVKRGEKRLGRRRPPAKRAGDARIPS